MLIGTGPMMLRGPKNERLELVRNPDYWGKPFYQQVVFRNIRTEYALNPLKASWTGHRRRQDPRPDRTSPGQDGKARRGIRLTRYRYIAGTSARSS
jgi:hypothetical protein